MPTNWIISYAASLLMIMKIEFHAYQIDLTFSRRYVNFGRHFTMCIITIFTVNFGWMRYIRAIPTATLSAYWMFWCHVFVYSAYFSPGRGWFFDWLLECHGLPHAVHQRVVPDIFFAYVETLGINIAKYPALEALPAVRTSVIGPVSRIAHR